MEGLTTGANYFVRAYATNAAGTAYGQEVSFTADPAAPGVTTEDVSDITTVSAVGNGTITNLGASDIVRHGVCWNTTGAPDITDKKTNLGAAAETGPFSSGMTGLAPDTTYYVRAYAENADGISYGGQKSFATRRALPAVVTEPVTDIDLTTATGNGVVSDLGIWNPDLYQFFYGVCWNTTGSPTLGDGNTERTVDPLAAPPEPFEAFSFAASMTGLAANTNYYVRAYATNEAGTAYGVEVSFNSNPLAPGVTTEAVSNITTTSAVGNGTVTYLGVPDPFQHGVCWNTAGSPTLDDPDSEKTEEGGLSEAGAFSSSMTGLAPETTYYMRAYATNAEGTSYGTEVTFTTSPSLPVVTTQAVTAIDVFNAVGNGVVTDLGISDLTQHGVCWSTTEDPPPSLADDETTEGILSQTGAFTTTITELAPETTYYVRAYATNNAGTAYGNLVSFTTLALAAPAVTTGTVSDIGVDNAVGGGEITNLGAPSPTQHGVCWNTAGGPTIEDDCTTQGPVTQTGVFSSIISGLSPDTTYYVRAYATNAQGTSYGSDVTFTTSPALPVVTTQAVTAIDVFGAVGNGVVTDLGISDLTQHGVCWSTTDSPPPSLADDKTTEGTLSQTGSFTTAIAGLAAETTYYVRAYATNNAGTSYGNLVSFTTRALAAPAVTTGTAIDIGVTSAVCGGEITGLGVPSPTQHGVCWNTAGAPTTGDACTTQGPVTQTGVFSSNLAGLSPNTTYYVRAYVTNAAGTEYGEAITFDTPPLTADVSTEAVSEIGADAAVGNGTIIRLGAPSPTQHGMCWNTAGEPTVVDGCTQEGPVDAAGAFTSAITGLAPDTRYFVRAYAVNAGGTSYGAEVSFTTQPAVGPQVETQSVDDIDTTSAKVQAAITQLGIPSPTQHGVCWNTEGEPTLDDDKTQEGPASGTGEFESALSGLSPNMMYYVRAYATNSAGTAYGDEVTFTTLALAPIVTTQAVSGIGTNRAVGNGTITTLGIPSPSQHGMCWNTKGSPTLADNKSEEGAADDIGAFSSALTGLTAGTPYYVRAYATNAAGTVYGEEKRFVTVDRSAAPLATIANAPPRATNQTRYRFEIGGIGVVAYQYKLDGDSWSQEQPMGTVISFELDAEGWYTLYVIGRNAAGIWQAEEDVTTIKWYLDLTPPETVVLANTPPSATGSDAVEMVVGGADVAAYRYQLDANAWSAVKSVERPLVLSDLSQGPHTLLVIGADDTDNWQLPKNGTLLEWTVDTSLPTAVLSNLPAPVTRQRTAAVTVASPVNGLPIDGYFYTIDDGQTWNEGAAQDVITLAGLAEGGHTLCVNAYAGELFQDGRNGTSSTKSATCATWRVDVTPPDAPELAAAVLSASEAVLSWTWQSDNDLEQIRRYRIWYADVSFDSDTLDQAIEIFCDIDPGPRNFEETYVIDGLQPGTEYFVAVAAVDMVGNMSDISDVIALTLPSTVPQIETWALPDESLTVDNGSTTEMLVSGRHFVAQEGANIVRFENDMRAFDVSAKTAGVSELRVDIPPGAPPGIYQLRVINKYGLSVPAVDLMEIIAADESMPVVRDVMPVIAPVGELTTLAIFGDNFNENLAGVNLLARNGDQTAMHNVSWIDAQTLYAEIAATDDFAPGRYDVQVVNPEGRANGVSAVKVEMTSAVDILPSSGGLVATQAIRLDKGAVYADTVLTTDNRFESGSMNSNQLRVKLQLPAGSRFQGQGDDGRWSNYSGLVMPPRQIFAADTVLNTFGVNGLQFSMGAGTSLRLADDEAMFVAIDVVLPSDAETPYVYAVNADGRLTAAGVNGTWRGVDIAAGGTLLAVRTDTPDVGSTAYTIGLLLTHMSSYAVGAFISDGTSGNTGDSYNYGSCFVGGIADSGAFPGLKALLLLFSGLAIGVGLVYGRRDMKARFFFVIVWVMLLGWTLLPGKAEAAQGAAVGAPEDVETPAAEPPPAAAQTPAAPAAEPETTPPQELKAIEKETQTPPKDFTPAGAGKTIKTIRKEKAPREIVGRRWHLQLGLGYGYIGKEVEGEVNEESLKNELDGVLYPLMGLSYDLSRWFALELGGRYDFYSGTLSGASSGGSEDLNGYTVHLGALVYFNDSGWRPLLMAGYGYQIIDSSLVFPFEKYKPAYGPVAAVGLQKGDFEFRVGYNSFTHDPEGSQQGVSAADAADPLDTSSISFEIRYRFF